jgi:transposase-like protein
VGVQKPNALKELAVKRRTTPEKLVRSAVESEGSITGAATKLGVGRTTISYWLKKMGVTVETRRVTAIQEKAN